MRRRNDGLTPREQQALGMLQRGYSNRDIAEELQISLAGAKYHVSEILSKLGASTREEAATFGKKRRWVLVPLSLGDLRSHLPQLVASKLALVAAATLRGGGVAIEGLLLVTAGRDDSNGSSDGTAATLDPCVGAAECGDYTQVEYATLEEAAAGASFQPLMPTFIPEGFEQMQVHAKQRDFSNPYVPEVHNDWITGTYRDGAGRQLVISQGFPAMVNARFAHPDSEWRILQVNGREGLWSDRAVMSFPTFNANTDVSGVLTVYVGRFDSGWGAGRLMVLRQPNGVQHRQQLAQSG